MKLFLDDLRLPKDCVSFVKNHGLDSTLYLAADWHIVRSYNEFVAWIETHGLPDFISFDHDLGLPEIPDMDEQNGMTCAKWLVNYCLDHELPLPDYLVHSQNPVGKGNIEGMLEAFSKTTTKK